MIFLSTCACLFVGPVGAPPQRFVPGESRTADSVPLMPWQRTLEDALALSRSTGKPLLICVNSDGEPASEALAAGRYRDPEFVALVDGFIPVLASPSRHREREHDDFGNRLLDPKFGGVVESEHMEIEPIVFGKYFNGRRVAPRHVGVSPEGEILFDLYLLNDLGVIDDTLEQHGRFDVRSVRPEKFPLPRLMASHDARARVRLEAIFSAGTPGKRHRLVGEAFSKKRSAQHPELIRMGLRDREARVRRAAARSVSKHPASGLAFMLEAFRVAEGDDALQEALLDGLRSVDLSGEPRRRRLQVERWIALFDGMLSMPDYLEPALWSGLLGGAAARPRRDEGELTRTLVLVEEALGTDVGDVALHVERSRAYLEFAKLWIQNGGGNATLMLGDARSSALAALAGGKPAPLAKAVLANVAYLESDFESAGEAAAQALPGLLPHATSGLTADVLDVLARVRTRSVRAAVNSLRKLPSAAIQDARAAYELLLLHPAGTVEQAVAYLNFLDAIEAWSEEERVARLALARFPGSGKIHGYFRHYVLRDHGAAGMGPAYEGLALIPEFEADHVWFAGLAILVGAERHGEDGRRELSLADYRASIEHFEEARRFQPEYTETSSHYIGMARAGIARQLGEMGDLEGAARALVSAAESSPDCFSSKDGRDRFPKGTVKEICRGFSRVGRDSEAEALRADLESLGVRLH